MNFLRMLRKVLSLDASSALVFPPRADSGVGVPSRDDMADPASDAREEGEGDTPDRSLKGEAM